MSINLGDIEQGYCGYCGKHKLKSKTKCEICILKAREKYNNRKKNNLCTSCGKPTNQAQCIDCRNQVRSRKNNKKLNNECRQCENVVEKSGLCKDHLKQKIDRDLYRYNNNMCRSCYELRIGISCYCFDCWIKYAIKGGNLECSVEELRKLWISQNDICGYSGRKLIPGKNASVDHKIPSSKGGSGKIENLHFIDSDANYAKSDLFEDDFIQLCYEIANYTKNRCNL